MVDEEGQKLYHRVVKERDHHEEIALILKWVAMAG